MIPGSMSMGIVFVLFLAVLSLYGCDEMVELESQWCTESISIDGNGSEWPEAGQYFENKSNILISVMNDKDNIYIRLLTKNKATQIMLVHAGFIIWIDETGGSAKKFGLKFPLAKKDHVQSNTRDHKPRNKLKDILEDNQRSLTILKSSVGGHHSHTITLSEAAEMGIYARLGIHLDYLVYELQVPNKTSAENNIVGIGFEGGRIEKPAGMRQPGGGIPGSQEEPPLGGGKPPHNGRPLGGKTQDNNHPESLDMWVAVQLMDGPTTSLQHPLK